MSPKPSPLSPALASRLLTLLYECVAQPAQWPVFLAALADAGAAPSANVVLHDLTTRRAQAIVHGIDPSELAKYHEYYSTINPWIPPDRPEAPEGNIADSDDFLAAHRLRKTEFYADWGRRNDVVHSIIANLRFRSGKLLMVGLNRGDRHGRHSQQTRDLLAFLVPHLTRVINLQDVLSHADAFRSGLDGVSFPVFVVDGQGRVLEMTDCGREMADRRDGVAIVHSVLRPTTAQAQSEFVACLGRLSRDGLSRATLVRVARGSSRDIVLVVAECRSPFQTFWQQASRFVVTVLDSATSSHQGLAAAAQLYGLTNAEAKLLKALLEAGSLDKALGRLSIARNTAKTQLRQVFQKTGTRRQSELVRLFAMYARLPHF